MKKQTPKISVILPSYNGEKYIGQSIQSVIDQTEQDWELIIVNDCSTDNTLKICQSFANKDSRIYAGFYQLFPSVDYIFCKNTSFLENIGYICKIKTIS